MSVRRIESVDLVRALAILAVIVLHTTPFNTDTAPLGSRLDSALVLDQAARFAVPCFFTLSGYFWAGKLNVGQSVWVPTLAMTRRLLFLFAAWSCIYLLPYNLDAPSPTDLSSLARAIYWKLSGAMENPVTLLLQGTKVHLWFLMGLLTCVLIAAFFLDRGWRSGLLAVALLLYAVGLLGKAYAATGAGFQVDFNFRNGPFFGLLFFVLGSMLRQATPAPEWFGKGLAMMLAGYLVQALELGYLHEVWETSLSQDFVLGTVPLGLGAAMVALSGARWLCWRPLAGIGPWVLGIYAIHFVFVDLLRPMAERFSGNATLEVGYPLLVFVLATLTARLLGRWRITRNLVR